MDENLHNDKLDEFVNRSFEQYSEDPSDSVWDAIENRLEAPYVPVANTWTSNIWKYAAALAILLLSAALINQHYVYKKKLEAIEMTLPVPGSTQTKSSAITNNTNQSITKTQQNTIQESDKKSDSNTPQKTISQVFNSNKTTTNSNSKNVIDTNTKTNNNTVNKSDGENNLIKEEVANNINLKEDEKLQINPTDNKDVVKENVVAINADNEIVNSKSELAYIETLDPAPTISSGVFNKQELSGLGTAFVLPAKSFVPNLYASIMLTPTLTYEIKPNKPSFDPMHQGQVNNEQIGATYSSDLNLRIGANLSTNWGIETGIGYTQMDREAVHKPQFKFKDHKHGGGPGGPGGPPDSNSFFDFDYSLNTFGGSTNIEVRVENVDSTYMFNDDDPINLNITTNEKLEILRVPLLGVYKIPMGRFGLILKGGFIGNFLLKNELQITGLNTNDIKLKDKEDNHHQRPPIESPSKFQLGYLASAGAYYNLTKNLNLIAEPFISGNLSTTQCNGSKLPSYYSIGVNAGLTYNF